MRLKRVGRSFQTVGTASGAAGGLTPKEPVPLWRWAIWWVVLGVSVVIFYVLLTPLWIGLRWAAWLAEFRSRRRR